MDEEGSGGFRSSKQEIRIFCDLQGEFLEKIGVIMEEDGEGDDTSYNCKRRNICMMEKKLARMEEYFIDAYRF